MSYPAVKIKKTLAIKPRQIMRGHTAQVHGIVHLPDRQPRRIITCSNDGSLRLWNLDSDAQIGGDWRDEGDYAVAATIELSPKGNTVASGSSDGTVRLWDVETGKVINRWKGHASWVQSVCWSPDGERVASGSRDGTARVWDVNNSEPVLGIETGHKSVHAASYSPNATMIATGGWNQNGIKIWDAKMGGLLFTIKDESNASCSLVWTSDETKLISATGNGSIRIFGTASWQQIAVLKGHRLAAIAITLSPNNRLLASTGWDQTVRLWNLNTELPIGPPLKHNNFVSCAAFSADGKLLATSCNNNKEYSWNIHAILKEAGLEDLLCIPGAPNDELKQNSIHASSHGSSSIEHISHSSQDTSDLSFLEADATRYPNQLGDADELPPGFFDNTQDHIHSPATHGAHPHSSAHRPSSSALSRLFLLLHRTRPNNDEATERQQPPVPLESRARALLGRLPFLPRSPLNTDKLTKPEEPPTPSGSPRDALIGRLTSLLRSPPNTNEATKIQQHPRPSGSPDAVVGSLFSRFRSPLETNEPIEPQRTTHCSRRVVEVAAI